MNYFESSLHLLKNEGINTASTCEYYVNETRYTFKINEIIEAYMQASDASQRLFYETLQKAIEEDEIKSFFEKMGQLLLMSSLSEKFIDVSK